MEAAQIPLGRSVSDPISGASSMWPCAEETGAFLNQPSGTIMPGENDENTAVDCTNNGLISSAAAAADDDADADDAIDLPSLTLELPEEHVPMIRQASDPVTNKEKKNATNMIYSRALDNNNNNNSNSNNSPESDTSLVTKLKNMLLETIPFSPALRRATTTTPVVQTFYCSICMENNSIAESAHVPSCTEPHMFCTDCLSSYIASQANDGIVNVACPEFGCSAEFTLSEIENYVESETWAKIVRFNAMRNNPDFRECSKCNKQLVVDLTEDEYNSNNCMLICDHCGYKSCFFHGDAHPDTTCRAYTHRMGKVDAATRALVKKSTRRCPSCRTPTEKNGGCNHMTCKKCGANWCWLCGQIMGDGHYDAMAVGGCPGGQFAVASDFAFWNFLQNLTCCGVSVVGNSNDDDVDGGYDESVDEDVERGGGHQSSSCGHHRRQCGICCAGCLAKTVGFVQRTYRMISSALSALEIALLLIYGFIGGLVTGIVGAIGIIGFAPIGTTVCLVRRVYERYKGSTRRQTCITNDIFFFIPLGVFLAGLTAAAFGLVIVCVWLVITLPAALLWPCTVNISELDANDVLRHFLRPIGLLASIREYLEEWYDAL